MSEDIDSIPPLRFNVPIDPSSEDDVLLHDRFYQIPNGLKQTIVKMALLKFLPATDDELRILLSDALIEQSKAGRRRGRSKAGGSKILESRVESVVIKKQEDVGSNEVNKESAQLHAENKNEVVASSVQREEHLKRFSGLLGNQHW